MGKPGAIGVDSYKLDIPDKMPRFECSYCGTTGPWSPELQQKQKCPNCGGGIK